MEEDKTKLKTLHTYTSDMADAIRTNEASVIKIALAEKQKREDDAMYKSASGTPRTRLLLIIGGIVLIAIACGAFYYVYTQKKNQAPVATDTTLAPQIHPVISADDTSTADITSAQNADDVISTIKKEMNLGKNPGSIKEIILNQTVAGKPGKISINDLLSILNISGSPALIRNLDEPYMLGVYTPRDLSDPAKSAPHLFMILNVKDYNLAYKAMLDWEPSVLHDLYSLFQIDISGDRSALIRKEWKDISISNKDGRILYDTFGSDVLYYIFLDKTNLVITDSRDAIKEINTRLLNKSTKSL